MRHARLLAFLLVALALPAAAHGSQTATLHVSFEPQQLGHATSVSFAINIKTANGVPSPLTQLAFNYPSDLGVAVSGLGLDTCPATTLEYQGPEGCTAEALMGTGSATAEIRFGPELIQEAATIAILRAPEEDGHTGLALYAEGGTPVSLPIIFPGILLPGATPQTETIRIAAPLIETLPGAPYASVTRIQATLGPRALLYYEHIHGKFIPYHPRGILLPNHCPPHGFPFNAQLAFLDGSKTTTRATIACSSHHHR